VSPSTRSQASNEVRRHGAAIGSILALAGARDVYLFGSMARGDADASSDVDLLLGDVSHASPVKLAEARLALEQLLARKVDLVVLESLPAHIRQSALDERIALTTGSDEDLS